ncbi:unnamed protein product [Bathycoccus prasinos]
MRSDDPLTSFLNDNRTPIVTISGEGVAMMTRGRKRKVGQRDSLWDLIVNDEYICFKHVLPRLNSTDLKFLHLVNNEARKLVKRSSREEELKKKFKIEEMSSISTLEFAWEHKSLWPDYWDETYFCWRVALTNKLELLKWAREWKHCKWDSKTMRRAAEQGNLEMVKYCVANECPINGWACAEAAGNGHLELLKWIREEKKCRWDEWTINMAAEKGNLEMVKYCVANECPIDAIACAKAAKNGHLEILKYLHEEVKAPWDSVTASWAAAKGHLHILEYLVERKYDQYSVYACTNAAMDGHLDCLKYLHETAKAPWNSQAVRRAHENNQTECLQYLLDNNCPLPRGWRYERGALYTN